ncbi:GNAT family N-acetyltransferase [Marinimicrobium alkaliphilum]|uniref:GNAT family N-acetyltransferase n=1 Tax=Marinimicrobium alkaliphilum TaxID=2202654 RepID=UPI00130025CC|nr:GNAT family N-acetyltransferase [Marinimicrobium alkaliphilum]
MTPEPVTVVPLGQRPEYLEPVARWHHTECLRQGLVSELSVRRARLEQQVAGGRIPVTLIALAPQPSSAPMLAGCISLVRYHYRPFDAPAHTTSPVWLSSLYVAPAQREQGIGTHLVTTAEAYARARGEQYLWLSTHDSTGFYRRRGWQPVRTIQLAGREAQVMTRNLMGP